MRQDTDKMMRANVGNRGVHSRQTHKRERFASFGLSGTGAAKADGLSLTQNENGAEIAIAAIPTHTGPDNSSLRNATDWLSPTHMHPSGSPAKPCESDSTVSDDRQQEGRSLNRLATAVRVLQRGKITPALLL
jgi:hypothetical protein